MSSLAHQHLRPIFMLPSKLIAKFQGWVYGYIRLLLGMACSVSCLFCVFTFIWYLAIRGLYGFLINFQFLQTTGCDNGDDENDLSIDYAEYQPGKRKSFLTRCRAQAELIQQALKKERSTDKSSSGNNIELDENVPSPQENRRNHSSLANDNSNHGLLVRNSSYVSEVYYDGNGHKIGEQIYLTNDSDGLEESYFQFKVTDVQHLKDLGGLSTSILVEEEPLDEAQEDLTCDNNGNGAVNDEKERKISCASFNSSKSTTSNQSVQQENVENGKDNSDAKIVNGNSLFKNENNQHLSNKDTNIEHISNNNFEKTKSIFEISVDNTNKDTKDPSIKTIDNESAEIQAVNCVKTNGVHLNGHVKHENDNFDKNKRNGTNKHDIKESNNKPTSRRSRRKRKNGKHVDN